MARKKREEEHENHERWLVSYADFITLLFAFFVIMYAISVVNVGKFKVASESIVSSFKNSLTSSPLPDTMSKQIIIDKVAIKPVIKPTIITNQTSETKGAPNEATAQDQATQSEASLKAVTTDLLKAMEQSLKDGQVKVSETERGISVDISANSLFDLGSASLRPEAIPKLMEVAKVLSKGTNQIEIEGHTDDLQINSLIFPSNWELSTARASSVVRQFILGGVAPQRMIAVGYAEYRPVAPNDTEEGRSRNRRVTVMVLREDRGPPSAVVTPNSSASQQAPVVPQQVPVTSPSSVPSAVPHRAQAALAAPPQGSLPSRQPLSTASQRAIVATPVAIPAPSTPPVAVRQP